MPVVTRIGRVCSVAATGLKNQPTALASYAQPNFEQTGHATLLIYSHWMRATKYGPTLYYERKDYAPAVKPVEYQINENAWN